jgi:hypothetical protein
MDYGGWSPSAAPLSMDDEYGMIRHGPHADAPFLHNMPRSREESQEPFSSFPRVSNSNGHEDIQGDGMSYGSVRPLLELKKNPHSCKYLNRRLKPVPRQ